MSRRLRLGARLLVSREDEVMMPAERWFFRLLQAPGTAPGRNAPGY